jgi:copper(I)-binding protein
MKAPLKSPMLALAAALVAAPQAHAVPNPADVRAGTVTIRQPWSRPAQAGMNGVGFFTLVNAGKTPVVLKSVQSPVAGKVEIHQSAMNGEVMTMRRQDTVTIPAGGQVAFAPGGYHLMLLGLKSAQAVGQKVPVTLVFDNGRKAQVQLAVQLAPPPGAQAMPMGEHHH